MEKKKEEAVRATYSWLWIVIILLIVVGVVMWWNGGFSLSSDTASAYQAVFLSNDQVYFGRLSRVDTQYPVLTDVYYLQINQNLQPLDQNAPAVPNLNLVKLGNELHGPVDEMVINRDHIVFFEDLKPDSQVVTAINQFKEANLK